MSGYDSAGNPVSCVQDTLQTDFSVQAIGFEALLEAAVESRLNFISVDPLGIGNALYEYMNYDEHAQPQTNSLEEYLLPAVLDVPKVEVVQMESPMPLNPLGIKGAGEAGTIPAAAAIIAAIENALQPFDIKLSRCPLQAEQIIEMIERSKAGAHEAESVKV